MRHGRALFTDDVRRVPRPVTSGRPLPRPVREPMEARFQHDFSRVRVHDRDPSAAAAGTRAYTIGSDVVLGDSLENAGSRLLAHELAHVVQQSGGGCGAGLRPASGRGTERRAGGPHRTTDDPTHEREADAVARGGDPRALTAAPLSVQREEPESKPEGPEPPPKEAEAENDDGPENAVKVQFVLTPFSQQFVPNAKEFVPSLGAQLVAAVPASMKVSFEFSLSGGIGLNLLARTGSVRSPVIQGALQGALVWNPRKKHGLSLGGGPSLGHEPGGPTTVGAQGTIAYAYSPAEGVALQGGFFFGIGAATPSGPPQRTFGLGFSLVFDVFARSWKQGTVTPERPRIKPRG